MAEPDPERIAGIAGSGMQILRRRLPGYSEDQIEEFVRQLNDLRLTQSGSLRTMMTARGAEELSSWITPYGRRFVRFLHDRALARNQRFAHRRVCAQTATGTAQARTANAISWGRRGWRGERLLPGYCHCSSEGRKLRRTLLNPRDQPGSGAPVRAGPHPPSRIFQSQNLGRATSAGPSNSPPRRSGRPRSACTRPRPSCSSRC